ncbi:DUF6262 family protein [Streptomyces parvus]
MTHRLPSPPGDTAGRTPAQVLRDARRRDSRTKRERVLRTVQQMARDGERITFAAVARAAGVSTWLTYADGVREHIDTAIQNQTPAPQQPDSTSRASTASLRTDLELAREEITKLRTERDQLQHAARLHLGQQLEQAGSQDLVTRVQELTQATAHLEGRLHQVTGEKTSLQRRVVELEDDLAAARTSLRQMIKNQSKGATSLS